MNNQQTKNDKQKEIYQNSQPIQNKNQKTKESDHSVGPDIYTGWQNKSMIPKLKQIPLIFAHSTTDHISKTLTSFGSELPFKVVYMGFRPASNMKAFKQYGQNKLNKYVEQSYLYRTANIKRFKFLHSQQQEKYFPIRPSQYRLFKGINPTCKNEDIKFSSQFEGGNLDLVIIVSPNEYDLLMRVDSNTRGHTLWYFFKVFDIKKKQKIKFNIINFSKSHLLYQDGMKPYVFRTSRMEWTQQHVQIEFKCKPVRYFQHHQPVTLKCLSFTYQFDNLNEEVYFAYSIPYSYSYLLHFLEDIQKKYRQFVQIDYEHESTGGISIPVVTITNFTKQTQKSHHLVISRLHPGQPQGNWMMEGFIKYLCSPEAHYIREKVQFKIVPMVNVDGVVLGNFRTGIGGRDLNRMFNNSDLFKETKLIKKFADQLHPQIFLDFHGHSAKKNVFIYGPDYKIQDKDYITSRIYPKIISKKTQAFRYYACVFKISQFKATTARAFLFNQYQTRFVFTVEASTYAYGHGKDTVVFSQSKYINVGVKLAQSLQQFIRILAKVPIRRLNEQSAQEEKQNENYSLNKSDHKQKKGQLLISSETQNCTDNFYEGLQSDLQRQLLDEIIENEKQIYRNQQQIKKQNHESDSDFQNQNQDYSQKQLKQIQKYLNLNKNDSIQNILSPCSKIKKSKKNHKIMKNKSISKVFQTIDTIPNQKITKSSVLNKPLSHFNQLSQDRNEYPFIFDELFPPQNKLRLNLKNLLTKDCSSLSIDEKLEIEKLRKVDAWKNSKLKKQKLDSISMLRNKSANQVYFEAPPSLDMQPLHKQHSKAHFQLKKKQPILTIKKSFLPTLIIKQTQKVQLFSDPQSPQFSNENKKNLINQILELHEKKKKKHLPANVNRKYRIAFFES